MSDNTRDLDAVENHDTDDFITRKFYGGTFTAGDIQENFAHVCLFKGGGMAKLNRKDVDSLISILHEVAAKMDQSK